MIELKNRKACYITLLDNALYINNYNLNYTERIDMVNGQRDVILKNSSACHNFFPFKCNENYFAIGGQDNWKAEQAWKDHKTFDEYKKYFLKRFGREYDRDAERWRKAQQKVINECKSLDHSDGLYIFKSFDKGLTWTVIRRIINTNHPGYVDGRKWGKGAEFDGHLCCVWFNGKWCLYVKENTNRGVRRIQYATSKDLITWGKFQTLDIDYQKYQWYYPSITNVGGILIGRFPICNFKKSMIREFWSTDGKKWIYKRDLNESTVSFFGNNPKPYYMPVQNTDKLIHENYGGLKKNKTVRIIKGG